LAQANAWIEIKIELTRQHILQSRRSASVGHMNRKQAGLTQGAIGDHIHLRQGTVSRLEAGEPAVQLRTLMAVLSALDLELVVRPRSKASAAEIEDMF
jgi:HTH-type transcriptional regulator/antitoxin HipB